MKKRSDIRDVAVSAGVSVATVSRVLSGNGYVAKDTRLRVQGVIADLRYKPNELGRALRTQRSGAVALLISNIQNSFYAAVALEIERRLAAIGYVTLLCNTNEDSEIQDRELEEITSRNVAGVLMLCVVASPRIAALLRNQTCIFINRRLAGFEDTPFVGVDDYQAARELASVIAGGAARRIGVAHGPLYSITSANRLRGLRDGLFAHGVELAGEAVIESSLSIEGGYQAVKTLLERGGKFDALFCGNDQIAYGAHRRCRELSLRAPEDIEIYGFDDNPMNQWLAPWLNTVRVPTASYARETVDLLRHLWDGGEPRQIILPYEIVKRS
jgi:LacI family transcriptional regulator